MEWEVLCQKLILDGMRETGSVVRQGGDLEAST